MRIRSFLIIIISAFLISCQSIADSDVNFVFPENTSIDNSIIWIIGDNDPLNLSSAIAERFGMYGFKAIVVPDIESIIDSNSSISSTGSAFAISSDLLVTNSHVVGEADVVSVMIEGEEIEADVIRNEEKADVAVLKIRDRKLPYAFKLSDTPVKGTPIAVLGYPLPALMGNECKYTNGIISADSGLKGSVLSAQISAEIQPGNSGGPVFTDDFTVVGIATEKLSDLYSIVNEGVVPQTVNYALKGEITKYIVTDLLAYSEKTKTVENLNEAEQAVFQVESDEIISNGLSDDILITTKYTYDWNEEYSYFYSYYYVNPISIKLFTFDGDEIGEMIESSYAGNSYVSEGAYDTVNYIVDEIFKDWVSQCLPQTNTGESVSEE